MTNVGASSSSASAAGGMAGGMAAAGWVGAALGWIGSIMGDVAGMLVRDEMEQTFREEMQRQKEFSRQAMGDWRDTLGELGSEGYQKSLDESAAERREAYDNIENVQLGTERISGDSRDRLAAKARGAERAELGAYEGADLGAGLSLINAGRKLYRTQDRATGSLSIFPYRMYAAQHSQDTLAGIGKILSSVGQTGGAVGQMISSGGPSSAPVAQTGGGQPRYHMNPTDFYNPYARQSTYYGYV